MNLRSGPGLCSVAGPHNRRSLPHTEVAACIEQNQEVAIGASRALPAIKALVVSWTTPFFTTVNNGSTNQEAPRLPRKVLRCMLQKLYFNTNCMIRGARVLLILPKVAADFMFVLALPNCA